jgi:hypothetical protein
MWVCAAQSTILRVLGRKSTLGAFFFAAGWRYSSRTFVLLRHATAFSFREWLMVAILYTPKLPNAAALSRHAFVRAASIPVGERIFADGFE